MSFKKKNKNIEKIIELLIKGISSGLIKVFKEEPTLSHCGWTFDLVVR